MEKIAKKLTDYYMRKGLINEKDTAIYQFGWQVSIEILISIIESIGIALYLKMFPEMIFLSGIFIPLRTWAGGVHLDRYWKCFVCSVMVLVVGLVSSKYIKEIENVQLIIKDDNQKTVYQHTLKLKQVEKLSCSSKTFKVENACVSDDFMRLGYLTSTDEDLLKKYPNISLEYRYLKSNKLNDKNDKNYVVFKKINGKTKEIVNQKIYQTYNHD